MQASDAVWVTTLCLAIAGIFTGALWLQWGEATYGWFAATALAWAALHVAFVAAPGPSGNGGTFLAVIAWTVALTHFLLAVGGVDDARVARAMRWLAAAGVLVLVMLLADGSSWLRPAARVWATVALPVLLVAIAQVLGRSRGRDDALAIALQPLGLGLAVVVVHDWLVFVDLPVSAHGYAIPYAAPPLFLGMAWALLRRFVGALEVNARLVADLEHRIEAERAALARSYAQLQVVERAHVLAEERERVMREMHDGLGSHLVSTLALLESTDVARDAVGQAVRSALDDLRLMVEALVPLDGDLVGALAMLRARLQPRLEAAGIRVEWRVSDLPRLPALGQRAVLQVMRILQEAITNVLRHADARTLRVETCTVDVDARRSVAVEISDDGRGIRADHGGRGLPNMRQRAADIGAGLAVEPIASGTRVRLSIPLDA